MPKEPTQSIQDLFLNQVRRSRASVTVFLVNGVKLQGIVAGFDNFSLALRRDGHTQLVYKHAISTIMPSSPVNLGPALPDEDPAARPGDATTPDPLS